MIEAAPTAMPRVRPARYGPRSRAPSAPITAPAITPPSPANTIDHTAFHGTPMIGTVDQCIDVRAKT